MERCTLEKERFATVTMYLYIVRCLIQNKSHGKKEVPKYFFMSCSVTLVLLCNNKWINIFIHTCHMGSRHLSLIPICQYVLCAYGSEVHCEFYISDVPMSTYVCLSWPMFQCVERVKWFNVIMYMIIHMITCPLLQMHPEFSLDLSVFFEKWIKVFNLTYMTRCLTLQIYISVL